MSIPDFFAIRIFQIVCVFRVFVRQTSSDPYLPRSSFPCFFGIPCFFFLWSLFEWFSVLSQGFWGLPGKKILVFFGSFRCLLPKKEGKKKSGCRVEREKFSFSAFSVFSPTAARPAKCGIPGRPAKPLC